MKLFILTILGISIYSCSEAPKEIEGQWDSSSMLKSIDDTLSIESNLDTPIEITTVRTDTGIIDIHHLNDSIISIRPTSKTYITEFHFDDNTHGIMSAYEIDSRYERSNENPKFTAYHINFSIFDQGQQSYIVFDHHYNQCGRSLDTIEYVLKSDSMLLIANDTIKRLKKKPSEDEEQ